MTVSIETDQPVELIQPMLAHERGAPCRQLGRRIVDRRERREIDPLEFVGRIQTGRSRQDLGIGRWFGTDDHLSGLASGREAGRLDPTRRQAAVLARLSLLFSVFVLAGTNTRHRQLDGAVILFRRQIGERDTRGQFHVDRESVCITARVGQQLAVGIRDGLEMDIAAKIVIDTQPARDFHQLAHGVIRALDHAGTQEQAFDIVALVEIQRQADDFIDRETRPLHIRGIAVDAIAAFVDTEVGQQDLEQRDTAPVRRIGMTDARAFARAHALAAQRMPRTRATGRTGGIVFRRVGEDFKFLQQLHSCNYIQSLSFWMQRF